MHKLARRRTSVLEKCEEQKKKNLFTAKVGPETDPATFRDHIQALGQIKQSS